MTGEFLGNSDQRKWVKMAKNSIFWPKNGYIWPFSPLSSDQNFTKTLQSFKNTNIYHSKKFWANSQCQKNLAQLFMPKNAIFGHFYPLSLVQISQKLTSHSKISIFTTSSNLILPNIQKWQKIAVFGPKNAIFGHFLTLSLHQISQNFLGR